MHEPSIRVVRRGELSDNTPQTAGLHRQVAFDGRNPDAKVLSAFLSTGVLYRELSSAMSSRDCCEPGASGSASWCSS
jgi:hypothetical protein